MRSGGAEAGNCYQPGKYGLVNNPFRETVPCDADRLFGVLARVFELAQPWQDHEAMTALPVCSTGSVLFPKANVSPSS